MHPLHCQAQSQGSAFGPLSFLSLFVTLPRSTPEGMKPLVVAACILFITTACQQEDRVTPANPSVETLNAALTVAGGLRISEFVEDGRDKTASVRPYLIVFSANGTVTASGTDQSAEGTYSVFRDDGRTELRMTFSGNADLAELSDDWYFISKTDGLIRFEDDRDILVFEQL